MPISILIYDPIDGVQERSDLAVLDSLKPNATVWVDVETLEPNDFLPIAQRFGIHELAIEDCFSPGHPPKFEDYGDYVFLILRSLKPSGVLDDLIDLRRREITGESPQIEGEEAIEPEPFTRKLAIFITPRAIITVRRREIQWLEAIMRQVTINPHRSMGSGLDLLLHRIVDVLFDRFGRGLNTFERVIDEYERAVLHEPDEFYLTMLLDLKREIISLKQIARDQRAVVVRLLNETASMIRKSRRGYFLDIQDHAASIMNVLDKQVDSILSVRDSYLAASNARLSDTMRVLTVITTIAAPINILVGIYGMNFDALPLAHNRYGFWMMLALIFLVTVLMLSFFRRRRWL